jgi:hypothetical protein
MGADLMAQNLKFRGFPGGQQDRGISFDRKAEYAAHIETLGTRRGDPADQFWRYCTATALSPAIEDRLHLGRVPGHYDIGE